MKQVLGNIKDEDSLRKASKEELIKLCGKAIELVPKNATECKKKAFALHVLGEYKEAIVHYDKAIALDPNDNVTIFNKGEALYKSGKKKKHSKLMINLLKQTKKIP